VKYISELAPERQMGRMTDTILRLMGKMDELSDKSIKRYILTVLEDLEEQGRFTEVLENESFFATRIKEKINSLTKKYAREQFKLRLENKAIYIKPNFKLKELINPLHSFTNITKHLYEAEGGVKPLNEFEKKVILKIAELSNVAFWHRNLEKSQGFYLNTFINHYPDFIVKLTNGELFLIETKGGHLENSPDTVSKLQSGEAWQNGAGKDNYRYYMVFDKEPTQSHDCAASLNRILEIIKSR
jgi:type III restriction enzyme